MSEKVVVIGLDGANRDVLLDGMNRGDLPTFRAVAEAGDIATLKAPLPPTTPVSMSSILTGRSPEGHGIFGFERDPRDGGYVGYDDIEADTLYDILAADDRHIVSINVPMTSPPPEHGTVVSGFPSASQQLASPDGLDKQLSMAGYRVEPEGIDEGEDAFIEDVFALAEHRIDVAERLLDEPWDVLFLMFTGDARLQHFIEDESVVAEFYQRVDKGISRLLDRVDEDVTVLIVSDHGFHPVDCMIDIESWLVDEGLLARSGAGDWSQLYGSLSADRYDWDDTVAYPGGAYLGNIRVDGDVDDVRERLASLERDGETVFRAVHRTEELYGAGEGPDLIPVPRRGYNYVAGYTADIFTTDAFERKAPDEEGVILTNDPGIDLSTETPRSVDVLPTLLDILGIETGQEFDGASLR